MRTNTINFPKAAFPFGGTINPPTTKYSASKGNASAQAAILYFFFIFFFSVDGTLARAL